MNGILVIDKPSGWTSHDVVARVRGILKEKKIGHLGTLDPLATGVLPLAIGAATRLVEFASYDKEYRATCLLGRTTDSCDVTGKVLSERPVDVPEGKVREELGLLQGLTEQVPPMVSAVKQEGRKLYELARKGVTVERKARPIRVLSLEMLDYHPPRVGFRVECSAGTYVRVLCQDLGERLGTGGCLEALQRTRVGPFQLREALTLESLQEKVATGKAFLGPPSRLVEVLPILRLEDEGIMDLEQGRSLEGSFPGQGTYQVRNSRDRVCAVAEVTPEGKLHPRKVFGREGIE
jgi:tRNA pseudouridine55 synthase